MNALSLLLLAASPAAPQTDNIDFAKAWESAAAQIKQNFYAKAERGEEMEQRLAKYAPIASKAKNKIEFGNIVNKMIAEFGDSHFALLTDEEQGYYQFSGLAGRPVPMPHIGAWFKKSGDTYTVQMVLNDSEAEKAGLQKGDMMLAADGQPFYPIAAFRGKDEKSVRLSLRRGGQTLEKTVTPKSEPAMEMWLNATRSSMKVIEHNGKKYGYIHVWTMGSPEFAKALELATTRFKDSDGFILDIRDGFGGRPEGYVDPFVRPDVKLEWKMGGGTLDQRIGYGKPVVVLVNEGSRSAKEVVAYMFKKSGRGTLVGTNTAGHVLGTTPMMLRETTWAYLEIPIVELLVDGKSLEGAGVAPDIEVKPERDAQGNDLQLRKALEVLQAKTSG